MPGHSTIDVGGVRNTVPPTEKPIRIFNDAGTEVYSVSTTGVVIGMTAADLAITGDLTISDDLIVTDDLTVTGDVAVGSTLAVTGTSAFTGAVTATGTVTAAGVIDTTSRDRQLFLAQLLTLTGDTRMLWLPALADTTTATSQGPAGRVLTHAVSQAGRTTALGKGYSVTFDGTNDYITTPDTADLSFGNATVDGAFSVVALVNQTNNAASKTIVAKYGGTIREWMFTTDTNEKMQMFLYDESLDVVPSRLADAANTVGSLALLGMSYSAATGGATAANDITLYQNGLAVASTATNAGTYVAMEDTTQVGSIGATGGFTSKFPGSMALVVVCAKALTASDMWAIHQLCRWYFNYV